MYGVLETASQGFTRRTFDALVWKKQPHRAITLVVLFYIWLMSMVNVGKFTGRVFVTKRWPGELVPELTGNNMGHNQEELLRHKTTWGRACLSFKVTQSNHCRFTRRSMLGINQDFLSPSKPIYNMRISFSQHGNSLWTLVMVIVVKKLTHICNLDVSWWLFNHPMLS